VEPIRESVQAYDAELFAMYMLRHARGHGVGTALLRELAGSLLSKGFTHTVVWVAREKSFETLLHKIKRAAGNIQRDSNRGCYSSWTRIWVARPENDGRREMMNLKKVKPFLP